MTNPTPHILTEEELDAAKFLIQAGKGVPIVGAYADLLESYAASHRALQARLTEMENEVINQRYELQSYYELEEQNRWVPVSERVPEADVPVWGLAMKSEYFPESKPHTMFVARSESGTWYYPARFYKDETGLVMSPPTHWRELPAAPTET